MGSFKSSPTNNTFQATSANGKYVTMSVVPPNDNIRCYQFDIPADLVDTRSSYLS